MDNGKSYKKGYHPQNVLYVVVNPSIRTVHIIGNDWKKYWWLYVHLISISLEFLGQVRLIIARSHAKTHRPDAGIPKRTARFSIVYLLPRTNRNTIVVSRNRLCSFDFVGVWEFFQQLDRFFLSKKLFVLEIRFFAEDTSPLIISMIELNITDRSELAQKILLNLLFQSFLELAINKGRPRRRPVLPFHVWSRRTWSIRNIELVDKIFKRLL